MTYNDLSKESTSELKPNQLLDIFFDSVMDMMEIDFVETPAHDLGRNITTPSFDDIRKKIRYTYEDFNGEKIFSMKVPIIDETKREIYRKMVFAPNKVDVIPEKGFYVKMYASLTIKPLGLVEVYFWGGKLQRMDKDHRILSPIKEFDRTEYLLFDYELKEYKQLDTEEMERVKAGIKRNKELDQLLNTEDKVHQLIRLYLEREELLELGFNRLNELAEGLQMSYIEQFKDDRYDVKWESAGDYKMKRSLAGAPIALSSPTTNDILFYLMRYADKLTGNLRDWLKIKIVFSSISKKEYKKLTDHLMQLSSSVIKIRDDIAQLENSIKDIQSLNWKEKKDLMVDELKIVDGVLLGLDKLTHTNTPKPLEFNKQMPLQGFIGYDLELSELYPNLAELENRRYLRENFSSIFEDEKYKEMVLNALKEKHS